MEAPSARSLLANTPVEVKHSPLGKCVTSTGNAFRICVSVPPESRIAPSRAKIVSYLFKGEIRMFKEFIQLPFSGVTLPISSPSCQIKS